MELTERIAAFSPAAWRLRVEAIGGEIHHVDGLVVMLTGIPVPPFNPTVVRDSPADPASALATAEALYTDTPFGMDIDAERHAALRRAAIEAGLELEESRPAMVVSSDRVDLAESPEGVTIARVDDPAELDEVAGVDAVAFDGEPGHARRFLPDAVLADPAQRVYAARVNGKIVAATETALVDGMLGVFGVGTLPDHRRRGIASAITSFAVRDRAAEVDVAVLWPSDLGYRVYERLGFRPASTWEVWVRKPRA